MGWNIIPGCARVPVTSVILVVRLLLHREELVPGMRTDRWRGREVMGGFGGDISVAEERVLVGQQQLSRSVG